MSVSDYAPTPNACWQYGRAVPATVTMDRDRSATAHYTKESYRLTTSAGSNGSVTPASRDYTCAVPPTEVTVTATPDSGYQVDSWSGACSGSGTTCRVTMDAHKSVSVTFEAVPVIIPITYDLAVSVSGGGTASGGGTYDAGTVVTVSATDTEQWWFVRWEGDITSTSRSASVTMDSDKAVTAVFQYYCDVIGCRRAPAPGNVRATLYEGTFTIAWDEVAGADRYRVSYRQGADGEWSELTDATDTDMSAGWTPSALTCGETYTFRVEAEGDGSTYDDVWGEEATSSAVSPAACAAP